MQELLYFSQKAENQKNQRVRRTKNMGFPEGFLWGAASSAYQVEGAYDEDGKGPGIWDALSAGHVKHGENGNTACDEYHRFREDVAYMQRIGLKAYRFSISWPRVFPEEGVVNPEGLRYYTELVRTLKNAGIQPMVTLYHWNLPMWMHRKGGWYNPEIIDAFADFARTMAETLGKDVRYWMTVNEPATFIGAGYLEGVHAPFESVAPGSAEAAQKQCTLTKHVLLAHGRAVQIIRALVPEARIGLAADGKIFLPDSESLSDVDQARRRTFDAKGDIHSIQWWLDPLFGKPQEELCRILRDEDLEIIGQPLDFIGYNSYKANNFDDEVMHPQRKPGMPRTSMGWAITPDVLYWETRFLYERYHLPILVSENGMANTDFIMEDGCVHDPQRISFLKGYLCGLKRAVEENYPVFGYLYWSILDNFEWAEGYDQRFGLIYVDFSTQRRILKDSAIWYTSWIQANGDVD